MVDDLCWKAWPMLSDWHAADGCVGREALMLSTNSTSWQGDLGAARCRFAGSATEIVEAEQQGNTYDAHAEDDAEMLGCRQAVPAGASRLDARV